MIGQISESLTMLQAKRPKVFIAIFAALALALAPGITLLVSSVEPSLEKVLPQDIEEVKTMNDMRTQFGADMMYLLVHAESPGFDARNPELLRYVDLLAEKIRTRELVIEVNTAADIAREAGGGILPGSLKDSSERLSVHPMTPMFFSQDYGFTLIRIRSDTGASAEQITKLVDAIDEDIESLEAANPGARVELTGFNAIDKATFEVIISDFGVITMISMMLVMAVVFITFRSFVRGMLPMAVVMNALVWMMGLAGYLGLTITVVSMVAAAMIMGLGIDFGIHVVHSYFEKRKSDGKALALRGTMRELTRAMIGASLTTTAGFLALLFGALPAMKTLGILLGIGIMSTLAGALFLLPAIIVIYDSGGDVSGA